MFFLLGQMNTDTLVNIKDVMYVLIPVIGWIGTLITVRSNLQNLTEWLGSVSKKLTTINDNVVNMDKDVVRLKEKVTQQEKELQELKTSLRRSI